MKRMMTPVKALASVAQQKPAITAWIGAFFGWQAVEWLVAAQIFAAVMAGLVSTCAFILTVGPAIRKLKEWFARYQAWKTKK